MTLGWALLLGIGLGLRHATDADHVVAVGTMLHRESSPLRAARLAALWGAGHSLTFLALGLLVVLTGVRLPPVFDRAAEGLVGAMLVGLGAWTLLRILRRNPAGKLRWRPVAVGVVHGLAGSAAIALLALAAIPTRAGALLYLGVFCVGTVMGMMLLTAAMAWGLGWSQRRHGDAPRPLLVAVSLASVALGIVVGARALS